MPVSPALTQISELTYNQDHVIIKKLKLRGFEPTVHMALRL